MYIYMLCRFRNFLAVFLQYHHELITYLIVALTLILLGNITVIVAIFKSKAGLHSRMNFFILHLAIAGKANNTFNSYAGDGLFGQYKMVLKS